MATSLSIPSDVTGEWEGSSKPASSVTDSGTEEGGFTYLSSTKGEEEEETRVRVPSPVVSTPEKQNIINWLSANKNS